MEGGRPSNKLLYSTDERRSRRDERTGLGDGICGFTAGPMDRSWLAGVSRIVEASRAG
jgi:hypothetical protein